MPLSPVTITAPATTANLGPGFDVFGLALKQPTDQIILTPIPEGVKIKTAGLSSLPVLPKKNTASVVAECMIEKFNLNTGIQINIKRGIPAGRGLGSSAATATAVAYGLNYMFNLQLSNIELVRYAIEGEAVAAGYAHADNVSAAIYGGFIIVRSYEPLQIVSLKAPENIEISVAYPHIITSAHKTEKSRALIPKQVPIKDVVQNLGAAAALVNGFATGDVNLIGASMSDVIVEPKRSALIPGYMKVREEAMKAGACGVAISGAGPALIAVVDKKEKKSLKVAKAMKSGFECVGVTATAFATVPGKGVHILEM